MKFVCSSRTNDWMVPHWTEATCLRSGDQRPFQAVYYTAGHGYRRRPTTGCRYANRCLFCCGRNQRRMWRIIQASFHRLINKTTSDLAMLNRMVPKHGRHSFTFHLPLRQKKQKKLVLNICYATSKIRQQPLLPPVSPNSSPPFADSNRVYLTFKNT